VCFFFIPFKGGKRSFHKGADKTTSVGTRTPISNKKIGILTEAKDKEKYQRKKSTNKKKWKSKKLGSSVSDVQKNKPKQKPTDYEIRHCNLNIASTKISISISVQDNYFISLVLFTLLPLPLLKCSNCFFYSVVLFVST